MEGHESSEEKFGIADYSALVFLKNDGAKVGIYILYVYSQPPPSIHLWEGTNI